MEIATPLERRSTQRRQLRNVAYNVEADSHLQGDEKSSAPLELGTASSGTASTKEQKHCMHRDSRVDDDSDYCKSILAMLDEIRGMLRQAGTISRHMQPCTCSGDRFDGT